MWKLILNFWNWWFTCCTQGPRQIIRRCEVTSTAGHACSTKTIKLQRNHRLKNSCFQLSTKYGKIRVLRNRYLMIYANCRLWGAKHMSNLAQRIEQKVVLHPVVTVVKDVFMVGLARAKCYGNIQETHHWPQYQIALMEDNNSCLRRPEGGSITGADNNTDISRPYKVLADRFEQFETWNPMKDWKMQHKIIIQRWNARYVKVQFARGWTSTSKSFNRLLLHTRISSFQIFCLHQWVIERPRSSQQDGENASMTDPYQNGRIFTTLGAIHLLKYGTAVELKSRELSE